MNPNATVMPATAAANQPCPQVTMPEMTKFGERHISASHFHPSFFLKIGMNRGC